MRAEKLAEILGADFYTGVPDSQLRAFCDYLMLTYGIDPKHHLIAANEGNCAALAAGYHLATGKVPVVYLQNSGEGNIINPVASLLNDKIYAIPVIFVIGWRGEPGVHDEPQHIYQGEVTLRLLEDMDIAPFVIGPETSDAEVAAAMDGFRPRLAAGKCAAFVIRKGALTTGEKAVYRNPYPLRREEIIEAISRVSGSDPVVSTTGKASRELFEIREKYGEPHGTDFLTVGSMGHASSIALGIALQKPETRVWCVDGDGAALMHLGAMALIGAQQPGNLVHIVINNEAHETVGGMPTAGRAADLCGIAAACGYEKAFRAETREELDAALREIRESRRLCFLEVRCAIGARADLGRPTIPARKNKENFMDTLSRA